VGEDGKRKEDSMEGKGRSVLRAYVVVGLASPFAPVGQGIDVFQVYLTYQKHHISLIWAGSLGNQSQYERPVRCSKRHAMFEEACQLNEKVIDTQRKARLIEPWGDRSHALEESMDEQTRGRFDEVLLLSVEVEGCRSG